MKTQILIINPFDRTGGSTVRMRRLFFFLRDLGYDVIYIESNSDLNDENVISVLQKNTIVGFLIGTIKRLFILLRIKYKILFIQKLLPFTVPFMWIAKLFGKKVIVDFDDWDSMLQKSVILKYLFSFTENLSFNLPDIFIVPHIYLKLLLEQKTKKRIYLIPQGVDTNLFCPEKYNKFELRKKYGFLQQAKIVGFLGCFTPAGVGEFKNILYGMKRIIEENNDVYFLVIGGGRLLNYYKELSSKINLKNTVFTDTVEYHKVPEYIAICDIMVIWMRKEIGDFYKGTLKILEYLSMNKLVVGHLVGQTKTYFGKYCMECYPTIESFVESLKLALDRSYKEDVFTHEVIKKEYDLNIGKEVLKEIVENIS